MHPLIQLFIGMNAAACGAAAVVLYFLADQVRFDPENFKEHRNASITMGLASFFFFVLLWLGW